MMTLIDADARRALILRAREAISRAIGAGSNDHSIAGSLSVIPGVRELRAGAFVTLRIRNELRGCIGYPEPHFPLLDAIDRCAVAAALSDPRFLPLTLDEWPHVEVELSVLGPMERVTDIADVVVGRHGLVVEAGHHRGLLLPQVASEWGWDAVEFASQTCTKAGLPRDAWKTGAALFTFEADVFSE